MKTLPHQPQRIAVYGGQVPGMQFVGRDPQSQKMLLIIPGCVEQTGDRGFVEDPDHKVPPPAFDAADKFVSEGSVK